MQRREPVSWRFLVLCHVLTVIRGENEDDEVYVNKEVSLRSEDKLRSTSQQRSLRRAARSVTCVSPDSQGAISSWPWALLCPAVRGQGVGLPGPAPGLRQGAHRGVHDSRDGPGGPDGRLTFASPVGSPYDTCWHSFPVCHMEVKMLPGGPTWVQVPRRKRTETTNVDVVWGRAMETQGRSSRLTSPHR